MKRIVFVKIEVVGDAVAAFELIDILGQTVQEWKPRRLSPGKQQIRLDVENHHSGIYLLKAYIGQEQLVFRIRKM